MNNPLSGLALSQRLESTEGYACTQYAAAHRRLFPQSGSEWMEYAGASVVYDGNVSPVTQTFGLGLFEELTAETLEAIERFFEKHGSPVDHEVSPFAGVAAFDLLCRRNYRPIEISSVLYQRIVQQPVAAPAEQAAGSAGPSGTFEPSGPIEVRVIGPGEAELWAEVSTRGWLHDQPEMASLLCSFSAVLAAREGSVNFLAMIDDQPAAAASLCLHRGVALFAGASTIPAMRKRGLQSALLRERIRYAADHGCDLASIVTLPGSDSQRNAERNGFQVAYTRMKWRRCRKP